MTPDDDPQDADRDAGVEDEQASGGGVALVPVGADEDGLRLDRWFRRRFPEVGHGRLEKWLRHGWVRVDGARAKAGDRLSAGQIVRAPPRPPAGAPRAASPATVSPADVRALERRILHLDDAVLVLDKPAGLAVQGGSALDRHLDAMLDGLRLGGERPRLTHRLDRDASGVLVLARTLAAARALTRAFHDREARKLYWAAVAGAPAGDRGEIRLALAKAKRGAIERMVADPVGGDPATTAWRVVARAGRTAAWLALEPLTGRTHQLRAHCALALGTPILGDGKYGGQKAFLLGDPVAPLLHLHARALRIPHPAGGALRVAAPLPEHMRATWRFFGFSERDGDAEDRWES